MARRLLRPDAAGRFLPWVIAVMVFLCALSLAAALRAQEAVAVWRAGLEGRLTLQIADMPDQALSPRADRALEIVRATPGVAEARLLDRAEVEALLGPWFGEGQSLRNLPVPALIDIRVGGSLFDRARLADRLADQVPGARLDDPAPWLDRLVALARLVEYTGLGVFAMVATAAVATVIFATRSGLGNQGPVIALLHLVGAKRGYIARQFYRRVGWLAFVGATLGAGAAYGLIYLAGELIAALNTGLLPALPPNRRLDAIMLALPFATSALAMLSAAWTVRRALKR